MTIEKDTPAALQHSHVRFWLELGKLLAAERERRHWNVIQVQYHGGPSYGIVQEHERGKIRSTRALHRHLTAFELNEFDVFSELIDRAYRRPVLTPEVRQLVRWYEGATQRGQEGLRLIASGLAQQVDAPALSDESRAVLQETERESPPKKRGRRR